jgi:glycosyltransferase involved in cell wall biosynthesis
MQRCFNILLELSKYSHLTVITFLELEQISAMKSNHPELNNVNFIPAQKILDQNGLSIWQRISNAILSRYLNADILRKTNSNLLRVYFTLSAELINNEFDLVIIEQIDLLKLGKYFRKKFKKIIFDAHNFDTELAYEMYQCKEILKFDYLNIKSAESKLYKDIDVLWTCSERDASLFREVNKGIISQIDVVPNGTRIPEYKKGIKINSTIDKSQKPIILFVGSLDYKPNNEGLLWFITNVLSELMCEFEFRIIGSGSLSKQLKDIIVNSINVRFLGFVESLEDHYNAADVVVIPILSGSGTRLKALEAMSYGCAIVSTIKGIEGINISKEVIIENDAVLMAKSIQELIDNPSYCREIGDKARVLVEKSFDWHIVGKKIKQSIEMSFQKVNIK